MKILNYFLLYSCIFFSISHPVQAQPEIPLQVNYTSPDYPYVKANANIYSQGAWTGTLHTPTGASAETVELAQLLKTHLDQFSGGEITLTTPGWSAGIRIGLYSELAPLMPNRADLLVTNPSDYAIFTWGAAAIITGRDHTQLKNAIYRFLEILGYRYLLPNSKWEVHPKIVRSFNMNVGLVENEVYKNGLHLFAGETAPKLEAEKNLVSDWQVKNRIFRPRSIIDSQNWQGIINDNRWKVEFEQNPQYSSSEGNKLCVLEPRVQEIVIEHVKGKLRDNPALIAASVTSSDGTLGWNEPCENGGAESEGGTGENSLSPTDRQVILANVVQNALSNDPEFTGKHVAFLAYGDTSPAPTVTLNSEVIVVVATAFLKDGMSPLGVADAYRQMGAANIGYYGYLGTQLWGNSRPTASKLSRFKDWVNLYTEYNQIVGTSPIRYLTGESSASFGVFGLGNYVFARMNTTYAGNIDSTEIETAINGFIDEFLAYAFPGYESQMREFYNLVVGLDGAQYVLNNHLLNQMYNKLKDVRLLAASSPTIMGRLDDLATYVHCMDLWYQTMKSSGSGRLDLYDSLSHFNYRIRSNVMYDFYNFFFDPTFGDLKDDMSARYNMVYGPHAVSNSDWPNDFPTSYEIDNIITQGILQNPPYPFEPKYFENGELVPVYAFDNDPRGRAGEGGQDSFRNSSGDYDWFYYPRVGQSTFTMSVMAGSTTTNGQPHPNGPVVIQLISKDFISGQEVVVDQFSAISDNVSTTTYSFFIPEEKLYIVRINDPGVTSVRLKWDKELYKLTHALEMDNRFNMGGYYYFYVPKSNDTVGIQLGRSGSKVFDPDNNLVYTSSSEGEIANIPISTAAHKGQLWKLYCLSSASSLQGCYPLNVPNQVARSPKEMLLQRSLIEIDQLDVQ